MKLIIIFILVLFSISISACSDDSISPSGLEFACGEGPIFDCNDCGDVQASICGCDDVTYENECEANCNGIYIYTSGPCQ